MSMRVLFFAAFFVFAVGCRPASALLVSGGQQCPDGYSPVITGHLLTHRGSGEKFLPLCVQPDMACACRGYSYSIYMCSCSDPTKWKDASTSITFQGGFGVSAVACSVCAPTVTN